MQLHHTTKAFIKYGGGRQSSALVYLRSYIYSFHMPLFFMISGMVFYISAIKNRDKYTVTSFIKKKFLRLVVPLLMVKYFILTPVKYYIGFYSIEGSLVSKLIHWITNTDIGHLWYLFDLFFIEIIGFVIIKCINMKKISYQMILGIILLGISCFANYFPYLGKLVIKNLYIYPLFVFAGIVLARYVDVYKLNIKYMKNKYLAAVFTLHLISWIVYREFFIESKILLFANIVGVFGSVWLVCAGYKIQDWIMKYRCCMVIEKNSMAIYLFHLPVQYLFANYVMLHITKAFFIVIPILVIVGIILPIIIANFIRTLNLKWIIGE